MTRDDFHKMISTRLYARHMEELTWAEIVAIIQTATTEQKEQLVTMFSLNHGNKAGEGIQRAINQQVRYEAELEATAMLADDTLTVAELLRIFG